jgi:hypothetical protein
MRAEWKSADEIAEDIAADEAPSVQELIVDLWRRADELQQQVVALRAELDKLKAG